MFQFEYNESKTFPKEVQFELTPYCNFFCNMCYIRLTKMQAAKQGNLLSTKQWISLAQDTVRLGTLFVTLTGGEAITRPDFFEIYRSIYELGLLVIIRTNDYLLTEETIRFLSNMKPYVVAVTLYGSSDETYQKVCAVKEGFTTVSKNIDALLAAGIRVSLTMTVTSDNAQDEEELVSWSKERGLSFKPYRYLINPFSNTERSVADLRTKPEWKEDVAAFDDEKTDMSIDNSDRMRAFSICRNYKKSFAITWDGKMTLCTGVPTLYDNPFEDTLEGAFNRLIAKADNLSKPEECRHCKFFDYCSVCPSKLYSETGCLDKCSENFCELTKKIYYHSKAIKQAKIEEKAQQEDCGI